MANIRCPHCGSPARMYANRWECGYCGDFGVLSTREVTSEPTQTQSVPLTLKFVSKLDFEETWNDMKNVISQYAEDLLPQLANVLIYEISHAMATPGHTTDNEKFYALDQFLQKDSDLRNGPDIQDIIHASKQGQELCVAQGKLTEDACGGFWQQLIRKLPSGDYPKDIEDLLHGLGAFYQYFVSDDWNAESLIRFRELRDAFESHWYHHQYFSPDLGAAIARLQRDDTGCIDDDCRDILVSAYPDHFRDYTLEDMQYFQWNYLLEDLTEDDPTLAKNMWETILVAAGPDFTKNPAVEEYLMDNSPFAEDD